MIALKENISNTYRAPYSGEVVELQSVCESITDCHHSTPLYLEAGKIVIRNFNIKDGVLVEENENYIFQTDHIFNSPSAAAACVLARRANGWMEWKTKDGKTLDEVKRK